MYLLSFLIFFCSTNEIIISVEEPIEILLYVYNMCSTEIKSEKSFFCFVYKNQMIRRKFKLKSPYWLPVIHGNFNVQDYLFTTMLGQTSNLFLSQNY